MSRMARLMRSLSEWIRVGALDFSVRPLARFLGADDVVANKMQFVGGVATGRVIPPIIEGANKSNAIRDYCVREGLALDKSHAYSDSASDYAMLAVVGRPTAVNPDPRLMGVAALLKPRTRSWGKARTAIAEYVEEERKKQHAALGLMESGANEQPPTTTKMGS